MDIFVEEIVERKRTSVQLIATFGIFLLSVLVCFLIIAVLPVVLPMMIWTMPLLVVGVVYLAYRLVVSQNVEFEYSMVNTEIDVDKIVNRRNRKKMTTVMVTRLEAFGVCGKDTGDFDKYLSDISVKKIYAAAEKKSDSNYFMVYFNDSVRCMLIFSPSEKIVNNIERLNSKR